VSNQINRKLARWAFRIFTSGGLRLPAFALVDDGVLIEHEGKILSASDWIPESTAITSLAADQSLCVRYPIRMQEDLLPVAIFKTANLVPMLTKALGKAVLPEPLVAHILRQQLRMRGSYVLHSATAARNGAISTSTISAPYPPISSQSSSREGSPMERNFIRKRQSTKRPSLHGGMSIWSP